LKRLGSGASARDGEQEEIVHARTQTDGGDDTEKDARTTRFLTDVLLERPDDEESERDFHEDEQPSDADTVSDG